MLTDGSSASATNEEPLLRSRKASLMEAIGKILWLAIPSILQQGTDWLRPIVFNIFVSRNVRASSMSTVAAEHEMDSVSLAIMSVNLLCFATAWGFNNGIDAFAPVAFGRSKRVVAPASMPSLTRIEPIEYPGAGGAV